MLGEVTLLRPEGTEDPGTAERLRAAVARLFRRSDRAWAGASLTPAGASVLAGIARQGPLRLSLLASTESTNPTMLSRLVHDLEKAGLVTRRVRPSDRRASLVEATARRATSPHGDPEPTRPLIVARVGPALSG